MMSHEAHTDIQTLFRITKWKECGEMYCESHPAVGHTEKKNKISENLISFNILQ